MFLKLEVTSDASKISCKDSPNLLLGRATGFSKKLASQGYSYLEPPRTVWNFTELSCHCWSVLTLSTNCLVVQFIRAHFVYKSRWIAEKFFV